MANTKYVANHDFGPNRVGTFHLATCPDVVAWEAMEQRGPVVSSRTSPAAERALPNLGYSDYREALVEQGFTPCAVCKP